MYYESKIIYRKVIDLQSEPRKLRLNKNTMSTRINKECKMRSKVELLLQRETELKIIVLKRCQYSEKTSNRANDTTQKIVI